MVNAGGVVYLRRAKWIALIVTVILCGTMTTAFAEGNMSTIEQKWLDFQRAVVDQQVKDGDMSRSQADGYLTSLEKNLRDSKEDVIYGFFKDKLHQGGREHGKRAAETYGKLTNRSAEDVMKLCKDGNMTVWQLAQKEGKLDMLKEAVMKDKTEKLDKLVKEGRITSQQRDEMLSRMKEWMENCTKDNNRGGCPRQ